MASLLLTKGDRDYIDQTIIDGGYTGEPVVTFENGETRESVLLGFTITHGYPAIKVIDNGPALRDLHVTENHAANIDISNGLYARGAHLTFLVENCLFEKNNYTDYSLDIEQTGTTGWMPG